MTNDTYSYTFRNVIYESVNVKSIKIRNLLKSVGIIQKDHFLCGRSENDTFGRVILESEKNQNCMMSKGPPPML